MKNENIVMKKYKVVNHLYMGDHGILYDYLIDPYTNKVISNFPEKDFIHSLKMFLDGDLSLYQSYTVIEVHESDYDIIAKSHNELYDFCFNNARLIINNNLDRIKNPYFSEKVNNLRERLNTINVEDFRKLSIIKIINLSTSN